MTMTILQPAALIEPRFHYSPGSKRGSLIFVAGQVAYDGQGQLQGPGDVAAQTKQTLQNLAAVLTEGGAGLGDVMKTTVFLKDIADFAAMNAVYADFFGSHKPARSTVQAQLVRPELLVEIEAYAVLPA